MSSSTRRRPQGISSMLPLNPVVRIINPMNSCECPDKTNCPHIDEDCECEARPCCHTIKTRRPRRSCDCPSQPCPHKPVEGRIKRVKCRVRRAGCAMARCTAELAMLHLHWELASECAPCKPRALTRRLCRRQQSDNELYRSNSFKFERFERNKDECPTPLRKQVSAHYNYPKYFRLDRTFGILTVALYSAIYSVLSNRNIINQTIKRGVAIIP